MTVVHVVSVSGGKDSTATALIAKAHAEKHGEAVRYVMADTGNEHEATISYATKYLPTVLGAPVEVVRADFSGWMAKRRAYIAEHWLAEGVPQDVVDRAVAAMQPTSNPYLDLCLIKGRFPSRRAQFCTQYLKTEPLVEFQMGILDKGFDVMSWQGVRGEESPRRALQPDLQCRGGGTCDIDGNITGEFWIYRPILNWKVAEVIDYVRGHGVELNPLYRQGMSRVGCMPCINAAKDEVREIANRFPEQIERIAEWERLVNATAKRGAASFFPAPDDGRGDLRGRNVREYVQWSRTQRGGRKVDMFADEAPACASAYGLCE